MGRIKIGLVKRTSCEFLKLIPDSFSPDFKKNKKALGKTMPSKSMRNKIAGYIARLKKNTHKLISEDKETK